MNTSLDELIVDDAPAATRTIAKKRGPAPKIQQQLGYEPTYTTAEAFQEFAASLPPATRRSARVLDALAERLPAVPVDQPGHGARLTLAGGHDG